MLSFFGSFVAISIAESRSYAGLGLIISPPIIQLVFSLKFLETSTFIKIISTFIVSVVAYFSSLAVIEFGWMNIGIDRYGYFDFLIAYTFFSILLWEIIKVLISKMKVNIEP